MRVRDVVAELRAFAANITNLCHDGNSEKIRDSAILAKFRVIPHYRGEPAAPKYQFNRCKPFRAIPFAPGNPRIHPFSRTESGR
jgi:hypothetical protein